MTRRTTADQHKSIVETVHAYDILIENREIFLFGEIDDNGDLCKSFLKNIKILINRSDISPIIIHQYSIGGDWTSGMVIFDAILSCPCPIIFMCHGIASSMGSIIPMACVEHGNAYRINMPNCYWLIHDGTTGISHELTHKQSMSWADWEKELKNKMTDLYVSACKNSKLHKNKSDKQIRAYLKRQLDAKEDGLLSSRDSVEHGFADAVLGDKNFESIKDIKNHWE